MAATCSLVPGAPSHCGTSVARIASAVVSSAMTFVPGACAASALPSAWTTVARCATGTDMPSCPQSPKLLSGSFIGLTYCSVMCSSSRRCFTTSTRYCAYSSSMPGFSEPPHALPEVVNRGGALLTKPVRIGTCASFAARRNVEPRGVAGDLFGRTGRRLHARAAAPDVVAVSGEVEAVGAEELVRNESLRLRRELREIVRPPSPGCPEPVDALRGGGADLRNGESGRRRNRRRGR